MARSRARPRPTVDAPIHVLPVGRDRNNQAIVALAVRTDPSALTQSAFIGVANLDLDAAQRRLEVYGDGVLIEAQDLALDPQTRRDIVIDDITNGRERTVNVLEVRLTAADPAATGDPDQLALDDRAWAIVPPTRERVILVVGDGDPYLETALSKLPNVDLWLGTPADYARNPDNPEGKPWDLVIFEGAVPSELPDVPILAIAPDRTSALGTVNGSLTNPGIGSLNPDEPILSFVDLSTLHVAEAARMTLPEWARAVIPGPSGAPLLYAGQRDGLPTAVLAFDPRQSDLPLQVAFPILLANLTGELLGGSSTPVDPIRPGDPVELTIRARDHRAARDRSRRRRPGTRAGHRRQLVGHLQRHRPAGRVHGHADPRSRGVTSAIRHHATPDRPSRELAVRVRRSGRGR